MSRSTWLVAAIAALLFVEPAAARDPVDLEDCYLRVAASKSTADAVHVAREICDAVFRPAPRAIAVLGKDGTCAEWWFDRHGRYESPTQYCSLEEQGDGVLRLACQWKGSKSFTYAELRANGDRYEGDVKGARVGELFRSLGGCVAHKAGVKPVDG